MQPFKIFKMSIRLSEREMNILRTVGDMYDESAAKVLLRLLKEKRIPLTQYTDSAPRPKMVTFYLDESTNDNLQRVVSATGWTRTATISALIEDVAQKKRRIPYPTPSKMKEDELRTIAGWGQNFPRGARERALRLVEERFQRRVQRLGHR